MISKLTDRGKRNIAEDKVKRQVLSIMSIITKNDLNLANTNYEGEYIILLLKITKDCIKHEKEIIEQTRDLEREKNIYSQNTRKYLKV